MHDPDPIVSLMHWVYRAKRTSRCPACRRLVRPGDPIVLVREQWWVHAKQTCIAGKNVLVAGRLTHSNLR